MRRGARIAETSLSMGAHCAQFVRPAPGSDSALDGARDWTGLAVGAVWHRDGA
jgi:hypothetical protein